MKDLLIKNGTIVTDSVVYQADLLLKNGKIHTVGESIKPTSPDIRIVDSKDHLIIPGGVDPHVHFDLPSLAGNSSDNFYTGSMAAIAGGTTTVIDFVTPNRGQSYLEALIERKELAENACCDYGFHMSPTWWGKNVPAQIDQCIKKEGISSFKIYMAYKETIGLEDEDILKVMKTVASKGGLVTMHCEEGDLITLLRKKFTSEGCHSPAYHPLSRPPEAEISAIGRAVVLAEESDCPLYVVHISTSGGVEVILGAKSRDVQVYGETCPQYLLLDTKIYEFRFNRSAPFVMSPPLRKRADRDSLWEGISNGTIQSVGTDHCPFNLKGQKDSGIHDFTKIPNGAGGVENRLSLLYTYGVLTGRITLNDWISLCSAFPAKIFGLGHRKGNILEGYDADLVLWDPHAQRTISVENQHQNCDSNIFQGFPVIGEAKTVIKNGQIVYESGEFQNPPKGEYLYRSLPKFI